MSRRPAAILISVTLVAAGCQTGPTTDYTAYLDHMPDSILVLPPINHTDVDEAPTLFMQTVSKPLAEQGYYVFPVAVVDRIMRDNGAETIAEMHEVPLSKLHQLFGADAVLYIEIEAWKTSYVVVGASTHVNLAYRLVDIQSGQTLWSRRVGKSDSSAVSAGGGDPLAAAFAVAFSLVAAQVKGISDAVSDPRPRFARAVNYNAFEDSKHGVLLGPRHPKFQEDQQRHHRQDRERLVVTSGGAIVADADQQPVQRHRSTTPLVHEAPAGDPMTDRELRRRTAEFERANPPYGTDPDRWVRQRTVELDAIEAEMSGCVVAHFGGNDDSKPMVNLLAGAARSGIENCKAAGTPADRLAAAKDLVFTLRLLDKQWQAVRAMPVLNGEYRALLPETGTVVRLCQAPRVMPPSGHAFTQSGAAETRLVLKTQPGPGGFLLKLVRPSDGSTVMTFFLRRGEPAEVEVPAGRYELRCAIGTDWYGPRYLFGPSTTFAQGDSAIELHASGDPYVVDIEDLAKTPIPPTAF